MSEEKRKKLYATYLLMSKKMKGKGQVYIGFTVNPLRRISQHNKGKDYGGAYKTSGKGPWDMILLVFGFPNEISALRFEWAWQHPCKSRILRFTQNVKNRNETEFMYRLRIMNLMLHRGPWSCLPLTIKIIASEYTSIIMELVEVPSHMEIKEGPIKPESCSRNWKDNTLLLSLSHMKCTLCSNFFKDSTPYIFCESNGCEMVAHIVCMAKYMLKESVQLIPTEGFCPVCHAYMRYGKLIIYKTRA